MPKKKTTKSDAKKTLNRQQQRDLDVEIGFLEGLVKRDPSYVDALQLLGDDYTQRGKFQQGLKVDEKLAHIRPEDPMVQYNLACSYSLVGQYELSVSALHHALDCGYTDFRWMGEDPDLVGLRAQPEYKLIKAKVKAIKAKLA